MYLSQSDIAILTLKIEQGLSFSDMLNDVIQTAIISDEYKAMVEGTNYYKFKNKILDKDFREYVVDKKTKIDLNSANNHLLNTHFPLIVNQKTSYIASKDIQLSTDNKKLEEVLKPYFGYNFQKTAKTWITGASQRGVEYLHPYVNSNGEFDYVIVPSTEIIPLYDQRFKKELLGVIRFYQILVKKKANETPTPKYKVEIWGKDSVYFYEEKDNGTFGLDASVKDNPRPHFYAYNTLNVDNKKSISWGRVPFIPLKNNEEATTDLQSIKSLIDDMDYNLSDFSNKLSDVARIVWKLKGYNGEDLSEFVTNLREFNAITVNDLGDVAGESMDIPKDSHEAHMDRIEENIFILGMAVNPKTDKFGNAPSGVSLRFQYAGLDLKSNMTITEMQDALNIFTWFLQTYLKLKGKLSSDPIDVRFNFDKSMIINDVEIMDTAIKAGVQIDNKTLLEISPWVKDPELVETRLKEQAENIIFEEE